MQRNIIFLAFFFFIADCYGQHYPFIHYTPNDGLVSNRVRKSWQDSKGRMFFMTFGGLSMYDGTRFRNYTVEQGLIADPVNDMIEMGDDSIWIACNANGLNYLKHGKIRKFITADGFSPIINKFLRARDGTIYVAADDGLFRFHKDRFIPMPFNDRLGRDASKYLLDVVEWNNLLLILSDLSLNALGPGNLYVLDKTTGKLLAEEDKLRVMAMCIGRRNEIYVANNRGILQLDTLALMTGKISYLPPHPDFRKIEPWIHFMYFDQRENFWAYTSHSKIIRVGPNGNQKEFSFDNGLGSNNFSNIFRDREGSIWITHHSAGVDKLVNDNIELYDSYYGTHVLTLYTDGSTDSAYIFDLDGNSFLTVRDNIISRTRIEGSKINLAGVVARSGIIYISQGSQLFRLDPGNKFGSAKKHLVYKDSLGKGFGTAFIDPYKNIIISNDYFLTVVIGDTAGFNFPISYYTDHIAFDSKRRLWGAARNGEIYVLAIHPDNPSNYLTLLRKFKNHFPTLAARSITIDKFDNIWIGSRFNGLFCFRFDEQLNLISFKQYTTKDGLSDNFVIHLTCDNENVIWASTAGGVDKVVPNNNKNAHIENITRRGHIYEHILKTHVTRNGIAWSTTADGNLIRITPSKHIPSQDPELLITDFSIGSRAFDSLPIPASFSFKENSFSISTASPSFYDEKQVKYSYWLQGSGNEQWSEPSNNSTFNFIGLHPGEYILKIKASFPGGRYPDKELDYAFVIHPPWWQTWPFRIGLAVVLISLLGLGIRSYYRRKLQKQKVNLEKQQAVEKERTRIATDIHDDLGSGLSRIRYLGEMVKLKTMQQQDMLPEIEKIAVFSDEMVDKMNEIVWALNEKNDTLEAMISYTRSFAVEYLSNNRLQCLVKLPDEIPYYIIKGETRRNIFLSVKESLHNIVKHAGASETTLTINIGASLTIDVHDNGKGINWETIRPFSNGIMNIKKRMQEAGGTAEFLNSQGTTVVLKVPLL